MFNSDEKKAAEEAKDVYKSLSPPERKLAVIKALATEYMEMKKAEAAKKAKEKEEKAQEKEKGKKRTADEAFGSHPEDTARKVKHQRLNIAHAEERDLDAEESVEANEHEENGLD